MSSIYVTVLCDAESELSLSASWPGTDHGTAEARARHPDPEFFGELLSQCRLAGGQVHRLLGQLLGDILFNGSVGDLLRDGLSSGELTNLFIQADEQRSTWPWELAVDPQSGVRPAVDAGMVRLVGSRNSTIRMPARGVLVVPRTGGQTKLKALQAATRALARKHDVDVYPADPATGPGVRRALEDGALLVHLDTHDGERALLDDGAVPLDRLGLDNQTWLTILGGAPAGSSVARSLRSTGSPLVITNQFLTAPHLTSACHRALYKALAGGDSVSDAMARARFALQQLCDDDDYSWASPVLWAAPGEGQNEPSELPFPPALLSKPDANDGPPSTDPPVIATLEKSAVVGVPMSAPVFVHDTLRQLTQGTGTVEDRTQRVAALRILGGGQELDIAPDPALSPAERIRALTDHFVGALGRSNDPLSQPENFESKIKRLAERLAISSDSVQAAAIAARAGRAVFLRSDSQAEATRLARGIASEIYGFLGNVLPINETHTLLEGPSVNSDGVARPGGWLFRTIASNWRRDELDPFQPEQSDPSIRMPLVARRGAGWQAFDGAWLIIPDADRLPTNELRSLQQALSSRILTGIGPDGRTYRLVMPRDFRVVLLGEWIPGDLDDGIPVVEVRAVAADEARVERWMTRAATRVGAPEDQSSATARRRAAQTIARRATWIELVMPNSNDLYETALCYAVIRGGYPEEAAIEGLRLALNGRLDELPPATQAVVEAALQGDAGRLRSSLAVEVRDMPDVAQGIASILGHARVGDDPASWVEALPESDFGKRG